MGYAIVAITSFALGAISAPLLLLGAACSHKRKEPKTKEEWKAEGAMDI